MKLCLSWAGLGAMTVCQCLPWPPASNGHFWSSCCSGLFANQQASVLKTAGLSSAVISESTQSPGHNGLAKSNNWRPLGKKA